MRALPGTRNVRDDWGPRTQKLVAVAHTGHPNPWGQTYDRYGQSIVMDTSGAGQYNLSSLISPYVGFEKPRKGDDAGDHPPITPVKSASRGSLGDREWKVYEFIAKNFLGSIS